MTYSMPPARSLHPAAASVCSIAIAIAVAAGLSAAEPVMEAPVSAPDELPGMVRIFNGTDLGGWEGDPRLWSVRDGVIHGETTATNVADGNTFLLWKGGVTENFELRLSFRCTADNNSGIQYRSRHATEPSVRNRWVVRGYQHELRNESTLPNVAGFIYDEGGKRGRICLVGERARWTSAGKVVDAILIDQSDYEKLFRIDDWNDVVIRAEGNRIRHFMNGRLTLDFTDDDPAVATSSGILALQLHAGKPMWAEFRDLRIRELP